MKSKSAIFVIFSTVFIDLVGFGMIIPLVGIYGRHFGATAWELAILGSIYSVFQFFFSPLWGAWSDRFGRRPILLISLLGSALSYFGFAFASSIPALILTRAFAGAFAANITTAQAYIADVTTPENRAKGMGLIGAAFGIGFTLGPPIGGISASVYGLSAPGLIAGAICLLNFFLAAIRLKESLSLELRSRAKDAQKHCGRWFAFQYLFKLKTNPALVRALLASFVATFAFSNLEQVFSLLIQTRFDLDTTHAARQTGFVLMWSGVLGALIQGGLIRKLIPIWGESRLAFYGFILQGLAMLAFSYAPSYGSFFLLAVPLALGSGFINPSLASLVSRRTAEHEQGTMLGAKEGLGSLARIFGPFSGILAFSVSAHLPFWIAGITILALSAFWFLKESKN